MRGAGLLRRLAEVAATAIRSLPRGGDAPNSGRTLAVGPGRGRPASTLALGLGYETAQLPLPAGSRPNPTLSIVLIDGTLTSQVDLGELEEIGSVIVAAEDLRDNQHSEGRITRWQLNRSYTLRIYLGSEVSDE